MAISCPKCGWQYDVTLFQFGRTINCSCGGLVGLEDRIGIPKDVELRFFADVMMHRLVRLMRALGFDTEWEDAISDAELVRRSLLQRRWILTLDRRLPKEWRVANVLLLKSERAFEQLGEVIEYFGLKEPDEMFTRCLVCNSPLSPAPHREAVSQAPESHARRDHAAYRWCPSCRKLYWEGSHTDRMRAAIKNVFVNSR